MKPRSSTSSSPISSSSASAAVALHSPVQKHVQMVSKAASKQLLFKFPDLPNPPASAFDNISDASAPKPISDFALISCFTVGSCKQVHLGAHILQDQPARPSSSSSCARIDSFEARTPLLSPPLLTRSRTSTPSLRHSKPRFKRSAHLPSVADKVLQRFARGASKCKYRMRLHVAARRYRLKTLLEP